MVDIAIGDSFSEFAFRTFQSSWQNSPFVQVRDMEPGNFRGARGYRFVNLPHDYWFDATVDGSGTKTILTNEAENHSKGARDPLAMAGGDITRRGGKRLMLLNQLDVETLGAQGSETQRMFFRLMSGMAAAAAEEGIVLWRGETAEMGVCVGSENPDAVTKFIWSATMLGMWRESTVITGDKLEPGQCIVALEETTLRTNGFTDWRRALRNRFGNEWWRQTEAIPYIQESAKPPTLYDTFLENMNGWGVPCQEPIVPLAAIAHITGGGIPGKLAKDLLFPRGLSAIIDDLWEPTDLMRKCVEWADITGHDRYKKLGCANGLLAVMDPQHVDTFILHAAAHNRRARVCGTVLEANSEPQLGIKSKFDGEMLEYGIHEV